MTAKRTFLSALFLFTLSVYSFGQESLVQDYSRLMEIPEIKAIQASETHLYVLSEREGMVVFRSYTDSLQWLYTSSGMQKRGNTISADVRFAYLFGDTRRLTVLEPTSVLGVYSSTLLPVQPLAAVRLENQLYLALGEMGLGTVSLSSPETVDSDIEIVGAGDIGSSGVIDLVASPVSNQLFALTDQSRLIIFRLAGDQLQHSSTISLNVPLKKLFIDGERIWGSTETGDIYQITGNGLGRKIGKVDEVASTVLRWKDHTFVRSGSGRVWVAENREELTLWKSDSQAGNYIAKSTDHLWISEYDKLSGIKIAQAQDSPSSSRSGVLSVKPIPNKILTYPNPLLLALELENPFPPEEVEFSYRGNVSNATIQKQGFVWRPTPNQLGMNWFTIIATSSDGQVDSTRFTVDVRSFNTPPRFSPVRGSTIAVEEEYQLQFKAIDPEDPTSTLIRYLGVDLPEGATVDEDTGLFTWTPSIRQVGETTFKIIATDQLGAASSIEVTLNVLDIRRGEGE